MYRSTAIAAALVLATMPLMATHPSSAAGGFTNFQLGDGPAPGVAGEVCPNANPNPPACQNSQAEPQIRADNAGVFYGASENGLGGGTEAYRSTDNGQHYMHLTSPNQFSTIAPQTPGGLGPAGGDVDVASAPQRNANGIYNVYVASLNLADVAVSTSFDGGATWKLNPAAASFPGDDREWIAADMASKVCISYRDLPAFGIHVNCSYDAGATFLQSGDAIDLAHTYNRTNFEIGNLAIDPRSHIIYQTYSSIDYTSTPEYTTCQTTGNPCNYHVVYMGVSRDGGKTFTDYTVHTGPPTVSYGHQFVNVSVDRRGYVYSVYSDNHNVYYSYSTDHGQTWTGPFQINTGTGNQQTAIEPWSVAGSGGRVNVVFYGADYYNSAVPPDSYPCNDPAHCNPTPDAIPGTAHWHVFFAENLSAVTNGTAWTTTQVTDPAYPVHYGGVCEGGVGCMGDRSHNRDLYDDFGIAVSPATNAASIIYSDDRFSEYNHQSRCTAAQDNTATCDHTNIATGISHIFATAPGGAMGGGTGSGSDGTGGECQRDSQSTKAEQDLMTALNAHRVTAGLPALTLNETQSDQARDHACDNAEQGLASDQDTEGNGHADRMRGAGLTFALSGENNGSVAQTVSGTAGSLLDSSLMADPNATLTILSPAMTSVGIGAVDVNGVIWVTEDFSG